MRKRKSCKSYVVARHKNDRHIFGSFPLNELGFEQAETYITNMEKRGEKNLKIFIK